MASSRRPWFTYGAVCGLMGAIAACVSLDGVAEGGDDAGLAGEGGGDGSSSTDGGVGGDGQAKDDGARPDDAALLDGGGTCIPGSDPSLVVHLAMDDGTGAKAKDCSGNGHDGTILGKAQWVSGKTGGALEFDGTSTCIDLGSSPAVTFGATAFTVAAWVNVASFPTTSSSAPIISDAIGNNKGWRFGADLNAVFNTTIYREAGVGNFTVTTSQNQATNVWKHLAMTYVPGGDLRLYIGGAVAAGSTGAPGIVDDALASTLIGCKSGSGYLHGTLDDFRIYSRALDSNELAVLAGP